MKSYKQFLKQSVRYKVFDYSTLGKKEFNEILILSEKFYKNPSFYKDIPKELKEAVLYFAKNKSAWFTAIRKAPIVKLRHGTQVYNSDWGFTNTELDKAKFERKRSQSVHEPIERPVIISSKGFNFIISKVPKFTIVDFGVEAFVIDIEKLDKKF